MKKGGDTVAKRTNSEPLTEEERRRQEAHKLATKRFYQLIVMLFMILALVIASVVLWFATPRPEEEPKEPSTEANLFAVKSITVEGNTKYLESSVIGESGVLIGQSIFTVDSNAIEAHLLKTFPYFASVEVQTLHMDQVHITVEEIGVIGVMYADGCWVPIGTNGKALDKQEITSDRPRQMLYIKGKLPENGIQIGELALEEYSASVLQTILEAINQYGLTDIVEIDITNMTDIRLNWRRQIEVLLGNTTNLEHEIGVASATIPRILESRGAQVSGRLNLTSYSNDALESQAIFTPSSLLPTATTATRKPAPGETTQTTTAPTKAEEDSSSEDSYYDEYYDDSDSDNEYYDDTSYYDEESDEYYEESYDDSDVYYEEDSTEYEE